MLTGRPRARRPGCGLVRGGLVQGAPGPAEATDAVRLHAGEAADLAFEGIRAGQHQRGRRVGPAGSARRPVVGPEHGLPGPGRVPALPRREPRRHRPEALAGPLVGVGDDPGFHGRCREAGGVVIVGEAGHGVVPDQRRQLAQAARLQPGRGPVAVTEAGHATGRDLVHVVEQRRRLDRADVDRQPVAGDRVRQPRRDVRDGARVAHGPRGWVQGEQQAGGLAARRDGHDGNRSRCGARPRRGPPARPPAGRPRRSRRGPSGTRARRYRAGVPGSRAPGARSRCRRRRRRERYRDAPRPAGLRRSPSRSRGGPP